MPFGLCNAGATYKRLKEKVSRGLHFTTRICYLDEVIIFGKNFETSMHNLMLVFSSFMGVNLCLKPSNYKCFQRRINFLGVVATESGTCDKHKKYCVTMREFFAVVYFERHLKPYWTGANS